MVINPTNSQRDVVGPRPRGRRHRGGGGDGRGRRQPGLRGRHPRCIFDGARRDPEDHPGAARALPRGEPAEADVGCPRGLPGVDLPGGARRHLRQPEGRPLHQEASSSARTPSPRSSRPTSRRSPRRRPSEARRSRRSSAGSRRRSSATSVLDERIRFDDRALDEIRPIDDRGRAPPPHPRLGPLHPRRDAGPGLRHPRHRPRRAGDRGVRGRDPPEVHAALQLPALLGRRGQVPARPRPARDRPRRPRPPRAASRCCRTRTSSPTPCASSPTSSSRTARRRWPRSAAARSRSSTPACRCSPRSPASPWA